MRSGLAAVGFEPTPPKRLVPKTSALDHSATQPDHCEKENASAWDRTRDLSVNSRALCQLSHGGFYMHPAGFEPAPSNEDYDLNVAP